MGIEAILHDILNYSGLGGAGAGGFAIWQSKANRKDIDDMRKETLAFMLAVSKEYASKDDISEIKTLLIRIEDKLDNKVDKG